MFLVILIYVIVPYLVWYLWDYPKNIKAAKATGLPLRGAFEKQLEKYLPTFIHDRIQTSTYGWQFRLRHVHSKILPGSAFILVNPGRNILWLSDPVMSTEILARSDEFLPTKVSAKLSSYFGENVLSSHGEDWRRHRKQVALALNEHIMNSVWQESYTQANQMLQSLTSPLGGKTDELLEGLQTLAMGVISLTGFASTVPWARPSDHDAEKPASEYTLTFLQTLRIVVNRYFIATVIPTRILLLSWMPSGLQTVGHAVTEFRDYASKIIQQKREEQGGPVNLIKILVDRQDTKKKDSLTDGEITGNMFLFTVAGFETTANAMGYTILSLASEPEVQKWVVEEIDDINARFPNASYQEYFPQMRRTIAVMYEILRLYAPLMHLARRLEKPITIKGVNGQGELHIPPEMTVFVTPHVTHVDPKIWPDPLKFKPSRWLDSNNELIRPPKGTFLAWSGGPRVCPGMKMSQVEFSSVLRAILTDWVVDAAIHGNETKDMARQRLVDIMDQSRPKMTLQVVDLKEAKLMLRPRR